MEASGTIRRIVSLEDPLLGPWLDLYQKSFPLSEQMLVSSFLQALRQSGTDTSMLVLERPDISGAAGIAWYQIAGDGRALWLIYFAVSPELRGKGIGADFYRRLLENAQRETPAIEAAVFEVERPDTLSGEAREMATRRIGFYRRLGARLITNIVYYQDVGWQPPQQMYLMAHPLKELDDKGLAGLVREVFGEAAEPFDRLTLD